MAYFVYGDKETDYLKSKDKKLGVIIDRIGHIEREIDPDPFSAVLHNIIGQQISAKALQTVWLRLQNNLGEITPPNVAATDIKTIQASGISLRKASYIKDFADKIVRGEFNLKAITALPDREAINALVTLKGVGVWTAEMILLFCLQRPDILSFGDFAILRGIRMVYRRRETDKATLVKIARRLSPYGSVASLYFWAVAGGALPELTDPKDSSATKKRPAS